MMTGEVSSFYMYVYGKSIIQISTVQISKEFNTRSSRENNQTGFLLLFIVEPVYVRLYVVEPPFKSVHVI